VFLILPTILIARFNKSHGSANPSTILEKLWVDGDCYSYLGVGKLYMIVEEASSTVYSNVFQITAMTPLPNAGSPDDIEIEIASTNSNLFNQVGGLGISGYDDDARIYPIKMIEYSVPGGSSVGLYRRLITPDASNFVGKQSWTLVDPNVETLRFYPLTVTTTGAIEHQRTMQLTVDTDNDGVEDIRGVSYRYVVRSKTEAVSKNVVQDNPMTATVETDHYARREVKQFVQMKNYAN